MPDQPDDNAVADIHDISVAPIVAAIMAPTIDVGGSAADVLDLLESITAAVIAITVMPRGDQDVLATFQTNVARKLALVRLETMPTAGSA